MEKNNLTILQINDTHGYLEEHQEMFWDAGEKRHAKTGGYAKISGYFKKVLEEVDRAAQLSETRRVDDSLGCRLRT